MFDELRLNGFIEEKNLAVVPGGFESIDDNLAECAAALVRAAPDAIISGPAPPLRALQAVSLREGFRRGLDEGGYVDG